MSEPNLRTQLDAALARNAESYEDGYNQGHADAHADGAAPDRLCALRAELDNLRDRVNALADEWDQAANLPAVKDTAVDREQVRGLLSHARQLRAAIVRGSDDD